ACIKHIGTVNQMLNQTWIEMKDAIQRINFQEQELFNESRHAIRALLPVLEHLEKAGIDDEISKHLSMFCLICKVKIDGQFVEVPYISLMPPNNLYTGSNNEFYLSVYDRVINGEERLLFREKFFTTESSKICKKLCQLVVDIQEDQLWD
ncbi:MAG: hypothetical protein AAF902_09835, partial [Chloroflexota bacterium]